MATILRQKYLNEILAFKDKDVIKVVTGIRRCGKSTLLDMVVEHIIAEGVPEEQVIKLNLESGKADTPKDATSLYAYFNARMNKKRKYLFVDEVQKIEGWEEVINAMRVDFDCDIFVTGSNAYLLSSELATYLSGRYVEIKMLPLTFKEYLDFRGLKSSIPVPEESQLGLDLVTDGSKIYSLASVFLDYRHYGGMPYLASNNTDISEHRAYMDALYQSVVVRDILDRESRQSERKLTNPNLLRRLLLFLADNIGNSNSFNSITNVLKSEKIDPANATVEAYIEALVDAYLFYPVSRYDIKGKEYLKTLGKYYIADSGLRNYLKGYQDTDQGRVLENIVYLQLLYNGFDVSVGKADHTEVDFIALKPKRRLYIQVVHELNDKGVTDRELRPLKLIKDAYPKYIIVGEGSYPVDYEGVRVINAIDFLMGREESLQ